MKLIETIKSRGGANRHFFVNIDADGNAEALIVIEDALYIRSDNSSNTTGRSFIDPDGGPYIGNGFEFGGRNGAATYRVAGLLIRVAAGTYIVPVVQR
jgi:hypothetical protein